MLNKTPINITISSLTINLKDTDMTSVVEIEVAVQNALAAVAGDITDLKAAVAALAAPVATAVDLSGLDAKLDAIISAVNTPA